MRMVTFLFCVARLCALDYGEMEGRRVRREREGERERESRIYMYKCYILVHNGLSVERRE